MSAHALPQPQIWRPKLWLPGRGERVFVTPRALRRPKEETVAQAISVVRSAAAQSITTANPTATLSGAPSASNVLVVLGTALNATANLPTGTGHTFTTLYGPLGSTNILSYAYVTTVTGTGTGITWGESNVNGCAFVVLEVSGLSTSGDGSTSGARSSAMPNATGNIVTANANDLLVYLATTIGTGAAGVSYTAPGAPWTTPFNVSSSASTQGYICNYQIVSSTGTYSLSQGGTNGVSNIQPLMVAIKQAAASRPVLRMVGFAAQAMARR